MLSAFPPVASATAVEIPRVATEHTARCTPCLTRASTVLRRFGYSTSYFATLSRLIFGASLVFGSTKFALFDIWTPYFAQIASLHANPVERWRMTIITARSHF